ncbi:MAG: DEAD/DEAH box helicase, partial [Myxococcales bacterium]
IVDEVHHADAASYRRVLDRLAPTFQLGLTATPDRADAGDVLGLFDDHVAFRADLGQGISAGRLVPFEYFGIRDTIDYANIPWRNGRFGEEALGNAVETQQRMEQMWRAWNLHPGVRSLVFCASVRHARFVADWLNARQVRAVAVYAGAGSADRASALDRLKTGELEAICAVDLFNEGVDLPHVDRVVMLRPTESPVVFVQQLGRGLRRAEGKHSLTVIDFVGNHRVFLNHVRTLLSLAGARTSVESLLRREAPPQLPAGCRVELELEAIDLLERLLPRGRDRFEQGYRELRDRLGHRPTIGAMFREGYLPSVLNASYPTWFDFVDVQGDLLPDESRALMSARTFFAEIERGSYTKSFKLISLTALLERDALRTGLDLETLAEHSHRVLLRDPDLFRDIVDAKDIGDPRAPDRRRWLAYWNKNPVNALTGGNTKKNRAPFVLES